MTLVSSKDGPLESVLSVEAARATAGWLLRFESEQTRRAYRKAQRGFEAFLAGHGVFDLGTVVRAHVDAWARSMEAAGLSPATRHLRLGALSSWFSALVEAGVVKANPCVGVKRPRVERYVGSTPCPATEALRRVLADVRLHRGEGVALAVELMAWYGLRVSSVCGLTGTDVITDVNGVPWLRVPVKGGRRVPLKVGSSELAARLLVVARGRREGPLFRTEVGEAVSEHVVRHALERASMRLGLPRAVSAHQLRTWAINTALDAGLGIDDVAEFAMHQHVETTRRYDRNRKRRTDEVAAAVGAALTGD